MTSRQTFYTTFDIQTVDTMAYRLLVISEVMRVKGEREALASGLIRYRCTFDGAFIGWITFLAADSYTEGWIFARSEIAEPTVPFLQEVAEIVLQTIRRTVEEAEQLFHSHTGDLAWLPTPISRSLEGQINALAKQPVTLGAGGRRPLDPNRWARKYHTDNPDATPKEMLPEYRRRLRKAIGAEQVKQFTEGALLRKLRDALRYNPRG